MKENFLKQVADEIGLVKNNTRLLIIISHAFVEMMVKALSEHYTSCLFKNHHQRLEKLKKEKIITDSQFYLYDWFRNLRNEAVHSPIFRLDMKHLNEIPVEVSETYLQIDSFHRFSLALISELWNNHLDILLPRFYNEFVEYHS